ncbi:MAG: ABC transporter ATP-binding protein [Methylobacter sp.]
MTDIAIRVSNLSKCYHIYEAPRDRLKQFVLPRLRYLTRLSPRQYFREFWALRDVSFEIKKGETVGIIGRNGSGKSTLLQMICGTLNPTSGSVQTNGRIAALLELGSGFNLEFTGRENVYMNATVLGLSSEEIDKRFDDIVAFADIGDFIEQPVKTYSSGMMVRLAFAVIAHVDADILVVDEALAVGDAFFTQKCMRFLRNFMKTGTVLFVSHDTGAIISLCNRAVWLDKGSIDAIGDAKEVCEAYLSEQHGGIQKQTNESIQISAQESLPYKNNVELISFDVNALHTGLGGAKITDVDLVDTSGEKVGWVVGGEEVIISIQAVANQIIHSPIVGCFVKDRLGQFLFGDTTFEYTQHTDIVIQKGELIRAEFRFVMPYLPAGDYSVAIAIAEGTITNHVQHHFIHDAILFKSHTNSPRFGLVGIPMLEVKLTMVDAKETQ